MVNVLHVDQMLRQEDAKFVQQQANVLNAIKTLQKTIRVYVILMIIFLVNQAGHILVLILA